ncbi:PucR family transcriptional regulator [Streptomyces sp. K1PN6]|uniref:PucR family transcriptional regulator n=2 Tax=Streptomyces acidicola TaxID=2596892 RepID=A0A5N8X7I8_9ACTN|nr:PucR family transcriptional regulator [Streptomyces acidicola]MPY55084.1 PucR family transcriptional regulator [Streptomyces acidicola]
MPDQSVPAVPSIPAVPPTPPVPLSALLAREDLALRLIAGPPDTGTVIHWAHTSEMADPYPYLLGGELLLTAGVHIPDAAGSGTYFDDYVSRIVAAGGAALGFGVAPVHDTVPRALVAACDSYELPLVEVPPRTTFSAVARAVWQLMAQARHAELRRVSEAQQSLATAASRPDPVPAVLRQLAQRVGGWAVLYGPEGAELATAGRKPGDTARTALNELAGVVRPGPTSPGPVAPTGPATPTGVGTGTRAGTDRTAPPATGCPVPLPPVAATTRPAPSLSPSPSPSPSSASDTLAGTHLAAYALGPGQGFVLGVAAPRRDPGDHTIVSVAAVLLSLLTGEHHSGAGAARSSALVRLLLGAAPEAVAPLLGGERWVVVHARPDTHAPDAVAASALGTALGSPLVDLAQDVVRVLVPADRETTPQPGWTFGVSAPSDPREWALADTQAARALARARATRTPLVHHAARPALADLVPAEDAVSHARTLLAPVAGTPALTETLRTWLSLHGSWDRTAVALSVHRNTVRQRVARCAALLAADLDDPDVRMELWFALRQHQPARQDR